MIWHLVACCQRFVAVQCFVTDVNKYAALTGKRPLLRSFTLYSALHQDRCSLQAVALSNSLVFILFTHIEVYKPGWTKHYRGICSESSFLGPSTNESLHCMCIEIWFTFSYIQNSFVWTVNSINNFWQLFSAWHTKKGEIKERDTQNIFNDKRSVPHLRHPHAPLRCSHFGWRLLATWSQIVFKTYASKFKLEESDIWSVLQRTEAELGA